MVHIAVHVATVQIVTMVHKEAIQAVLMARQVAEALTIVQIIAVAHVAIHLQVITETQIQTVTHQDIALVVVRMVLATVLIALVIVIQVVIAAVVVAVRTAAQVIAVVRRVVVVEARQAVAEARQVVAVEVAVQVGQGK